MVKVVAATRSRPRRLEAGEAGGTLLDSLWMSDLKCLCGLCLSSSYRPQIEFQISSGKNDTEPASWYNTLNLGNRRYLALSVFYT